MKGTYTIQIRSNRIVFSLEIQRNITVIRGDSATGKTTFIEMLQAYERLGKQSGVTLQSKKECHVLTDYDWEDRLPRINNSIVFVDEGNKFVSSPAFARAIMGSDNYYVLITRENLYQLPYSVDAVLKLKTTTSKFRTTYVKSYPHYEYLEAPTDQLQRTDVILTEDSNSGHEMFSRIADRYEIQCDSADGKSNIMLKLMNSGDSRVLVVADGAAFGAEMEKVYSFHKLHYDLQPEEAQQMSIWFGANLRKASKRKAIPLETKKALYNKQNGKCMVCGEELGADWSRIHVDHVIPWALVGDELDENYQDLCETCNECKSARTDYIFKSMLNLV